MTPIATDGFITLREENRRLRALVDFGRQVTAERDLRPQLRLLCAELCRSTGCAAAAVILLDPERGTVDTIESIGLSLAVDAQWQQAVRAAAPGAEAEVLPAHLRGGCAVPLLVVPRVTASCGGGMPCARSSRRFHLSSIWTACSAVWSAAPSSCSRGTVA
ncbi:MAG: hypothetical protein LC797_05150 [Chloroflexi bacterium]|nr:hypothetical protein [Chloroflexota bacterium]